MTSLVVSEVFGPTVQGEGPAAGRRAAFLRLGGCNLTCSWCDTAYTWDASRYDLRAEMTRLPLGEVLARVRAVGCRLVVVTGGEPLLQQGFGYGLPDLAGILAAEGATVHVETNGTISPCEMLTEAVGLFVVSPKLSHAGLEHARAIRWPTLRVFARLADQGKAALKIVCRTAGDVADAAAIADTAGIPHGMTWVMPEGTTAAAVVAGLGVITGPAVALGLNVSGRQHVLTWGDERGR